MKKNARNFLLGKICYAKFSINYFYLLCLFFVLINIQTARSQTLEQTKIDIAFSNIPLKQALDQIQKKTSFNFIFSEDILAGYKASINVKNTSLSSVLETILAKTNLEYVLKDNKVIIRKKAIAATGMKDPPKSIPMTGMGGGASATVNRIVGKVLTINDRPLSAVSVKVKEIPGLVTITDSKGSYSLTLPPNAETLVFSMVGYISKEVRIGASTEINVALELEDKNLESVVVTGVFTRKAESFTGSASTFTQQQLRSVGNQNIIESLKMLDPSFIEIENITAGSDPNAMPDIQIRGGNSLPGLKGEYAGNPNTPLFILDGFETNLQKIYDLDMNRVASVTILKDAAAKAIYGSRAANGVIVVETKRPEMGKLRFSYTGDFNVSTPDLSSYELANATEKLQVEESAGRYTSTYNYADQLLKEQYNRTYAEIARGVNTYWLSQPVQTGVGQKHTLSMEGGDPFFRYGADFTYNNISGVMKGSDRRTIAGNVYLSYRIDKFMFRNTLMITGNRADDSPYGAYSTYSRLNPYWTPYDLNGSIKKILGQYSNGSVTPITYYNPLFDATLGTKNFSKYTDITDNFQTEWTVTNAFKVIGRFGYTQKQSTREDFYPANHTRYAEYAEEDYFKRGDYYITDGQDGSIKADVTLNYSKQLGKHLFYFNGGWNLYETTNETHGMQAQGFLNDRVDNINFAKQYLENGRPIGSDAITRETGLLSALNYSYNDRYLADLTFRRQGSSVFGSDNRWGNFWSAGIGWNIHKESFLQNSSWLDQLKLRASTGYTGSQNFNPYQALATYNYYTDSYYDNIVGAKLMGLANNELKWQQTQDYNIGLDVQAFKRLNLRVDYYISNTKNLLTDLPLPGSVGFSTVKENLGEVQNKGVDAVLSYKIFNDQATGSFFNVFLSVGANKNKLVKISDALNSLNEERENERADSNKPFIRYKEGQSTTAIWAVPSKGIDPITGSEIYVKQNGDLTYVWDANDQVVVGEANPKVHGSFGFNTQYKGWGLNCGFMYKFGGQYYNQTLVDRVENVDIQYNVDRRVFTSTWKNPGDDVFFKRISATPTRTNPTSRFVQDFNELILSSLNLSYDFRDKQFLKRSGLERLRITFFTNDIARIASVKAERGLDYPFARSYSLSLQVTL
ncbi:SusC/RagA family TonB-linked outer membrane protein [Pedobacter sp. MW01-1-1]|uniref:SusC/RagA family TonB-linked outer membrane protein n=1 Tax=Pedobacter sp. MW01-1-1 TaxID=3383027 RepID=UPI003FF14B73